MIQGGFVSYSCFKVLKKFEHFTLCIIARECFFPLSWKNPVTFRLVVLFLRQLFNTIKLFPTALIPKRTQ